MSSGQMNLWDAGVWKLVVTAAILLGNMLLANCFRTKIGFMRRSLIPSSVVGGFLYALSRGMTLEECAKTANACGAKAVQKIGATAWVDA